MKISQSFIKAFRDYLAGKECGNIIKANWVDGRFLDDASEAMKIGAYFEFILTGAIPKDGIEPKPGMMASGKDMLAPYRRAHSNATRIKRYLDSMGLKIVEAGKYVKKEVRMGLWFDGVLDVIAEATKSIRFEDGYVLKKGTRIVIDIKYSGQIDDRWSVHGWNWTPDQIQYHGTQAKQYKLISDLDFYFLVCSSTNETDVKLFRTIITPESLQEHVIEAENLLQQFEFWKETGFTPRPDIARCSECPLNAECKEKHVYPDAIPIEL